MCEASLFVPDNYHSPLVLPSIVTGYGSFASGEAKKSDKKFFRSRIVFARLESVIVSYLVATFLFPPSLHVNGARGVLFLTSAQSRFLVVPSQLYFLFFFFQRRSNLRQLQSIMYELVMLNDLSVSLSFFVSDRPIRTVLGKTGGRGAEKGTKEGMQHSEHIPRLSCAV